MTPIRHLDANCEPHKRFIVEFDSLGYVSAHRFADTPRPCPRRDIGWHARDRALPTGLHGSNFTPLPS
jgi:hypothetical protein